MALQREVPLLHKTGLHLRAAGRFAETAARFASEVHLAVGGRKVNAKSVLDILTLGAGPGIQLRIVAEGPDAGEALDELEQLVRSNFGSANHDRQGDHTNKQAPATPLSHPRAVSLPERRSA